MPLKQARRYRFLFETMDLGVVYQAPDGRIIDANPAAERILGLTRAQMEGRTLRDPGWRAVREDGSPFPGDEHPAMVALRTGTAVRNVQMGIYHPAANELRWIHVDAYPEFEPGSASPCQVLATFTDITERLRAEQQAVRWQNVFTQTELGLAIVDAATNTFVDVNNTFASQRGYTPAELVGLPIVSLYAPEALPEVRERLGVIDSDGHLVFEGHHLRKDRTSLPVLVEVTTIRDAAGKPASRVVYALDITERNRANDALRASEASLRSLFDAIPESVFMVEPDGTVLAANETFATRLDTTVQDALGRTVFSLLPDDTAARRREWYAEVFRTGKPLVREDERRGRWLQHYMSPVKDVDGKVARLVVFAVDTTARRQMEHQLRQAQKLEALGQLAGGVAHDFNNILAATMMHLGLLQLAPGLSDEIRRSLKELEAESQRAAGLTRQLLMFSRRAALDVKPHRLGDIVANLLKMLRRLIGEHVELRFVDGNAVPAITCDAGMIEQVVMNLVVNARDAMPRGGQVTIATSSVVVSASDATNNPARQSGTFACLSVADTGVGMDAATTARVFEPFFTTKDPGHGTGLGLATVHGIVTQHRGWVEVTSAIGQGSTFAVFLPALPAHAAGPDTPGTAPQPELRGTETVLLVEDESTLRNLIARTLAGNGYRVIQAANGREALERWQQHGGNIDLLFTDMVMPGGVSGLELVERLQELRPGLKAILSSGYSAEFALGGLPNRADTVYLPKPYDAPALSRAVRACLDGTS